MTDLPPDWKQLFARLEREREQASQRANKQQAVLNSLVEQVGRQNDELRALSKMLRRRETQLKAAEREIRKLRRRFGLDEPDPDPDAAPVPGDDDATPDADTDGASSTTPDGGGGSTTASADDALGSDTDAGDDKGKKKRKRRGGGRRPPPPHLPSIEERYDVCACAHCGGKVLKRDLLPTKVFSVVKTHVRCRDLLRERVLCADPACGKPTVAQMPPMPCARALYDCGFLAWLVTMKYAFLIPLDRIRSMLASQGVHIAMGTLVHLVERAADLAGVIDGEHFKQLKRGPHLCFDGTGLKVLMPGQHKAWDGYLEVFARDHLTVFQFDLTKHADALRDRLSKVRAVLVTDAESRNMAGAPGATLSHCNAHMVRKLKEAARAQPQLAGEGLAFFDELYDIEETARVGGLVDDALEAFRRQRCPPVLDRLRRWLEGIVDGDLPPSDPVRKAAKYYLNHWSGLTRYARSGHLPIDNNEAEREFQRHAKLRYASLFAGSEEGAHR